VILDAQIDKIIEFWATSRLLCGKNIEDSFSAIQARRGIGVISEQSAQGENG